ncbi:MAG TPA: toll/interleukin-1 receptor domain-containing protein [Mycobacteriales bacterium]|nr:toll/interleukin-1 receptor domain-containing protein [Mycobacteriales bacterium]
MADLQPSIFISYAHEDAGLAHALAAALEAAGARVWLDQGELLIGDSLIDRISEAIAEFDFVAALVSPASVESNWCRKERALAMSKQLRRRPRRVTVLPLRVADVAMPPSLADVNWLQLDPEALDHCAVRVVKDAARHLGLTAAPPTPGHGARRSSRDWTAAARVVSNDEPVRIVGVDTEGVGRPRNDVTRGSGLYRVPLVLNRVPPEVWSARFADAWNSPPAWTSMHRPGIASVHGDRIVLDSTTIDELERYHLQTLQLVVRQLNETTAQHLRAERARAEAAEQAAAEHDRQIREIAERLRFDEAE